MRESSIVMLLVLAIATCTARPHVALQVPVAGSLSSPRERVQCLLACPVGLAGSKLAKAKKPYVVLQVSLAGSLSSPRECVQFLSACPVGLARSKFAKAECRIGCGSAWPSLRGARLVPASVQVSVPIAFQRPCYLG